ncbi:MAG: sulfite exporter TauE/SafE family protein [Actinobacteria bacterium]|nr:sulfite exporter TauE/SafE family protein [Actinomycetota bacterium]
MPKSQSLWVLVAIGLLGGVLSGLLGVGGGIIMIPLMTWLLRLRQHAAHGTSLIIIIPTATAAFARYLFAEAIEWGVVLALAATAIGFAIVGARLTARINAHVLRRLFALLLLATSVRLFVSLEGAAVAHPEGVLLIGVALIAGAFTGLVSGTMGVGGGIVMVPAMVIFMGIDQHVAQGVSLAVIVPTAISGGVQHYRMGNVVTRVASGVTIGGVAGGLLGAQLAQWLPEAALRIIFAAVALYSAQRMLGVQAWVTKRLRAVSV